MSPPVISGGQIVAAAVPYHPQEDLNVLVSTFYFLSGTIFSRQVGGASGTLAFHYPTLTVSVDFPEDLKKVNLPHLALVEGEAGTPEAFTFGSPAKRQQKQFTIYGFAGSYKEPGKNKWERTSLLGDCRKLLEDSRIPLYDFSSGTSATLTGYGVPVLLSSRPLPPGDVLAAEKYRFEVTFGVDF